MHSLQLRESPNRAPKKLSLPRIPPRRSVANVKIVFLKATTTDLRRTDTKSRTSSRWTVDDAVRLSFYPLIVPRLLELHDSIQHKLLFVCFQKSQFMFTFSWVVTETTMESLLLEHKQCRSARYAGILRTTWFLNVTTANGGTVLVIMYYSMIGSNRVLDFWWNAFARHVYPTSLNVLTTAMSATAVFPSHMLKPTHRATTCARPPRYGTIGEHCCLATIQ